MASDSEALSSAILEEMEVLEAFAPDTPPQGSHALGAEASSDNFGGGGTYGGSDDCGGGGGGDAAMPDSFQRSTGVLGPQVRAKAFPGCVSLRCRGG